MGLMEYFTGRKTPSPQQFQTQKWDDYQWIVTNLVEKPSVRDDLNRLFSEKLLLAKVQEKVKIREHDAGVREAIQEQMNVWLSRLKRIDDKVAMRIQDVVGAQTGHPTPTSPLSLTYADMEKLLSDLTALQGRINTLSLYARTEHDRIDTRNTWQSWSKRFIENAEIPLRDVEASAAHLKSFIDRHS